MPLTVPLKTPPSLVDFKDTRATPKALEAAKDFLKGINPRETTFAAISESGEVKKSVGVCHYNAPRLFHGKDVSGNPYPTRSVFATDTNFKTRCKTKKEAETLKGPFLRWFLYDSPFSFLIINKDDYEFCRDYGFILSYDAPFQYFHGACIISRHFREVYTQGFKTFNYLTQEKSVDPLIAFTLVMSSNISTGRTKEGAYVDKTGHRLGKPFTLKDLKNAFSGNPVLDISKSYFDNPSIYGSSNLFRSPSCTQDVKFLRKEDKVFDNLIREFRGEKQEVDIYRPPNPFERKTNPYGVNMDERFTNKEAIEVLAPYYQREIEKWAKESNHNGK